MSALSENKMPGDILFPRMKNTIVLEMPALSVNNMLEGTIFLI